MKKSVFAVCVTLTLCCFLIASVAAIDTPWLPIEPDGGGKTEEVTTETVTTEEVTTTPGSAEITTPPSSDGTEEQPPSQTAEAVTQAPNGTNEEQPSSGGSDPSSEQSETAAKPAPDTETDAPKSSEPTNGGCGGALNGSFWIVAAICAAWMLCRTKRAEKKEVNG